jgi:hypothetical protein
MMIGATTVTDAAVVVVATRTIMTHVIGWLRLMLLLL